MGLQIAVSLHLRYVVYQYIVRRNVIRPQTLRSLKNGHLGKVFLETTGDRRAVGIYHNLGDFGAG